MKHIEGAFDWDNEEYNSNLIESEPDTAPYPDNAAELPGIELEQDLPVTGITNDEEADDIEERDNNQESAAAKQNYEELLQMNMNRNETDNNYIKNNFDEPTEVKVLDVPIEQQTPEEYIDQQNKDNNDEHEDELTEDERESN